jgi:hypothetical protein
MGQPVWVLGRHLRLDPLLHLPLLLLLLQLPLGLQWGASCEGDCYGQVQYLPAPTQEPLFRLLLLPPQWLPKHQSADQQHYWRHHQYQQQQWQLQAQQQLIPLVLHSCPTASWQQARLLLLLLLLLGAQVHADHQPQPQQGLPAGTPQPPPQFCQG